MANQNAYNAAPNLLTAFARVPTKGYLAFGAAGPTLVSAVLSGSVLTLTFTALGGAGLLDAAALRLASNYTVTPPAGSLPITVQSVSLPTSTTVALQLAGDLLTGGAASVSVAKNTARDAVSGTGNSLTSAPFTVPVTALILKSAQFFPGPSRVRCTFSKPVRQVSASTSNDALNPANYTISLASGGTASATGVVPVDSQTVDVLVPGLVPGPSSVVDKVTPANLVDLAGNVVT